MLTGRSRIAAGAVLVAALLAAAVLLRSRARPEGPAGPVRIAAAADLRFALDELVADYRSMHPAQATPVVTYGSSGVLFAQIANGAPFDLFLSADIDYPRRLMRRGIAVPDTEFTYGAGRIVLWVPATSALDLERDGLAVLLETNVGRIAIANPEHAPYGRAAESALRAAGVYDRIQSKLVRAENVGQAFQFAQSRAADVGIIALSLALAPPAQGTGRYWVVPANLYPPLEQGGVLLKTGRLDQAREFRAYLATERARGVLQRFGFSRPDA